MTTTRLKIPTLASVCVGAVLLTTVIFILCPHSTQVSALILNPPVSPGGGVGSSLTPGGVGYGYLEASAMTQGDRLVFVCDGCPKTSGDCQGTPSWGDHYKQNWQRLTQSGGRRKRRSASWNGWNFDDPWSWSSWSPWSSPPGGGGQGTPPGDSSAFLCPPLTNQSATYQLNPNFKGYPAEAISAELGLNLPFFQFLLSEAVLSDTPPVVLKDSFVTASRPTCPSTEQQLWRYRSLSKGQVMCWVLANFGDFVRYRECGTKTCQNLTPGSKTSNPGSNTGSSFWADWPSGSFWGSSSPQNGDAGGTPPSLTRRLCLPDYRAVSLWAYCPSLNPGQRIVRDRIILPGACGCRSVACQPV